MVKLLKMDMDYLFLSNRDIVRAMFNTYYWGVELQIAIQHTYH